MMFLYYYITITVFWCIVGTNTSTKTTINSITSIANTIIYAIDHAAASVNDNNDYDYVIDIFSCSKYTDRKIEKSHTEI